MKNINREILRAFKDGCLNNTVQLPNSKNINFFEKNNGTVLMILSKEAAGLRRSKGSSTAFYNMQTNDACFEGWALAVEAYYKSNIIVELDMADEFYQCSLPDFKDLSGPNVDKDEYQKAREGEYGHYGRFLYRVLKFSEQYAKWFRLSDKLRIIVGQFRAFLTGPMNKFKNNLPSGEADIKGPVLSAQEMKENIVEEIFAIDGKLQSVIGNDVQNVGHRSYRQFPVGLYLGDDKNNIKIFTGHHSAIDLWNLSSDCLNIVELKYHNKMIGIITEIFFYVNYMHDFVSPTRIFELQTVNVNAKSNRGYKELCKQTQIGINRINGVLLDNVMYIDGKKQSDYHPLINKDIIDLLNDGTLKGEIFYYQEEYQVKMDVDKVK